MKSFVQKQVNPPSEAGQMSLTARNGSLVGILLLASTVAFGEPKTVTGTTAKPVTSTTTDAAAAAKGGQAGPTKEEQTTHHEKLAEMHTKMAECLKSSKTLPECQQEYTQTCTTFPKGSCSVFADSKAKGVAGKTGPGTGTATGSTGTTGAKGAAKGAPKGKPAKTGTKTTTKK